MIKKFYVSSIAFQGKTLDEIFNISVEQNFNLEFSSGIPFDHNNIMLFNKFSGKKIIHNYFPPPQIPFVINLASNDKKILKLSIEHCKKNIIRTSTQKLPFYAIHSGFCLDPKISSLGRVIKTKKNYQRDKHLEIFKDSLIDIIDFAKSFDVLLLIENNVLSKANYCQNDYKNHFLCVNSEEIIQIFKDINSSNFGLLLDTAHLKVSSLSLGLDPVKEASALLNFARAIHHSDNDGTSDTNESIGKNYWFLPLMKKLKNNYHVLEVKNISIKMIKKQIEILTNAI